MAVSIDQFRFAGNAGAFKIADVTGGQWDNALQKAGWREAHNGHLLKRLKERGAAFGMKTLKDFESALRNGTTEPADGGALARVAGNGRFKIIYKGNGFITLTGP